MNKILVVYYSRTGTTKKVAEFLKDHLNCDIEEIRSVRNRSGVAGYLLSGKEAMKKQPAEILANAKDVADYDLVIVGTPIWGWNISSPIRTYLMQNSGKFKELAGFCTMGGSGDTQSFSEMEKISNTKFIGGLGLLTKEVIDGSFQKKTEDFVKKVK